MKMSKQKISFFLMAMMMSGLSVFAAAPEHFYNPPENINLDPAYVPGAYSTPETQPARTIYENAKQELATAVDFASGDHLFTQNGGDVTFTVIKNETASVLGYFREFFGVLKLVKGQPDSMVMVIDINSLDTAVPGRNNRLIDLFFRSTKPEFGTATVNFDKLDLGGKLLAQLKDGKAHPVRASGKIHLNGVDNPLTTELTLRKTGAVWSVKTAKPVDLLISDFAFTERIPDLLKACNHKSLGNHVAINVNLYLK